MREAPGCRGETEMREASGCRGAVEIAKVPQLQGEAGTRWTVICTARAAYATRRENAWGAGSRGANESCGTERERAERHLCDGSGTCGAIRRRG